MTVELDHEQFGDPDAPVLVLLGALGTDLSVWEPQISALSADFRVVAVNLRGHGWSSAPAGPYSVADLAGDVLTLLGTHQIESAHFAGVGLGSVVGQHVAAHHPARTLTLTLIAVDAMGTSATWSERSRLAREHGIAAIVPEAITGWITEGLAKSSPELVDRLRETLCRMSPAAYASCCDALTAWDGGAHDRARIVAPTLVLGASAHDTGSESVARQWAREIAGSRFHAVGTCGELANLEQAGQVTECLRRHLSAESTDAYTNGMTVRRAVLGEAHVDRSIAASTEFTAPFQDFITRTAWGDIWSRPGLDHHTRRLLTLAVLTAVGNEHELDMHIRAALRAGVDPDLLVEVFLHTAVYAGVPNSNRAFALGKRALADHATE
ncbi:3-oxoadipate enol-lactone hydrolase/4-carboxymuconolactone decarboxylase [Gordonia namibiensis NBRC 108229]|uniref:3-oxoadipate enol-lactone hydrolase/4-carboxymuconolactone decarboxylase n=1 Tax=Gordonia namibiensis NBRC 108229 TaxID=1208314 RepID=K6X942_9ACTN|nr:4-carboxymuconolactone decarboxylase [Gordonia namibiensis]GAC00893.1 3-oxoadipate enol-lactone hydrolase/4-carboxymuconolactone decarboxylase [Gordonia namibiensis NBRC 108229]